MLASSDSAVLLPVRVSRFLTLAFASLLLLSSTVWASSVHQENSRSGVLGYLVVGEALAAQTTQCPPTPADSLGPFYKPDAPVRSSVGKGYVLSGTVRSSKDCSPIPNARVELWLAGPDTEYDDEHRATIIAGSKGEYRFESNFPPPYMGRPSHIHIKVSAEGHRTLVTQHYPVKGKSEADFDLVLAPSS
jgi:protocatechuate 3,4-dioxygenase beta subunit